MSDCPPPPSNFGIPAPEPNPFADAPPWQKEIGEQPCDMPLHACMGLNSCKGSDRFGKNGPNGNDPNDCAGQGYCATSGYGTSVPQHQCHVQNNCRNQGGCGLYGSEDEMSQPGLNECRSLGSCATPINSERFITTGPYRGTSVWKRARAVFEEAYPSIRLEVLDSNPTLDLPQEPGPPPAPFGDDGPSYQWISNDNQDRGNMTACGQSGLSGAGGCA